MEISLFFQLRTISNKLQWWLSQTAQRTRNTCHILQRGDSRFAQLCLSANPSRTKSTNHVFSFPPWYNKNFFYTMISPKNPALNNVPTTVSWPSLARAHTMHTHAHTQPSKSSCDCRGAGGTRPHVSRRLALYAIHHHRVKRSVCGSPPGRDKNTPQTHTSARLLQPQQPRGLTPAELARMAPKQRMRIANEKATKFITQRGNVPKSTVSTLVPPWYLSAGWLTLEKKRRPVASGMVPLVVGPKHCRIGSRKGWVSGSEVFEVRRPGPIWKVVFVGFLTDGRARGLILTAGKGCWSGVDVWFFMAPMCFFRRRRTNRRPSAPGYWRSSSSSSVVLVSCPDFCIYLFWTKKKVKKT